MHPVSLSCQPVRQSLSTARRSNRPIQAARIGAVVLGCAALGAVTCHHALAQQDAPSDQSASLSMQPTASVDNFVSLALNPNQLSASQTRAVGEFNWIELSGSASEPASAQATLKSHTSGTESIALGHYHLGDRASHHVAALPPHLQDEPHSRTRSNRCSASRTAGASRADLQSDLSRQCACRLPLSRPTHH